ncbi:phosphonate C-P lyase system protein PhnH [Oricola thermophila]|uniref:Phosphonate C-P lyase system protein PhnH n=1 Tax=Oricola thermophila TaxID=2742145 RepID=A0A6N1V9C8_9HYPH|nr:phosphonate C-P lyase system protein PhnH [Oricola thermophila]QKV17530.1 phosphonate C-P lyase system protein PhnH [Oricola thermophila]
MMASAEIVEGGFAEPVFAAQSVFRAVMDAMAQPGTVHSIETVAGPPAPLSATAGAVVLTLADADTPVWLDANLARSDAVKGWISFHAGAPFASMASDASFGIVTDPGLAPPLSGFTLGTQEYPDRSTTLILQVETLTGGDPLTLRGPGIRNTRSFAPHPLPGHFEMQWRENGAMFPRGIDIILAAPNAVACLPRTTRIVEGGA